jgi:hypothetical protein
MVIFHSYVSLPEGMVDIITIIGDSPIKTLMNNWGSGI